MPKKGPIVVKKKENALFVNYWIEIKFLEIDCIAKNLKVLAQGSFIMGKGKNSCRIESEPKRKKMGFCLEGSAKKETATFGFYLLLFIYFFKHTN